MKIFRCDADDGVLQTAEILRAADDCGVAFVTVLPHVIADDHHWMRIFADAFFGGESAAEEGPHANCIEIIGRDHAADNTFGPVPDTQGCTGDTTNDERLTQCAVPLKIEKVRVGKTVESGCAAYCPRKGKHPLLVSDGRVRPQKDSFDPAENGCVGSDAKSQAKNCQN